MAKKTKGKRYTKEEKQKVLDFANSVDAEKGRGGVAAAAREFGVSPLTITSWRKRAEGITGGSSTSKGSHGATEQSRALHRLGEILDAIDTKKSEIDSLEQEYSKLKKKV
jgi:transposase-like protein